MNRPERYTLAAIALHWVIALGIAAQLALGVFMAHAAIPLAEKFRWFQLHKSIGITVLFAVVLRVLWRATHRPPRLPPGMPRWEVGAAHETHMLLYALMLALPLSGWAMVSASPFNLPTMLYGVIPWPHLPVLSTLADKKPVEAALQWVHAWLAWTIIALILLHIAAALRHQFEGDNVLYRMLPVSRRRLS